MSHTVQLERRAGGATTPVFPGEAVLPREAVRLSVNNAMWGNVEFRITDVHYPPRVYFGPVSVDIGPQGGFAYLDTHAPDQEGAFYLRAKNNLLSIVGEHEVKLLFTVAVGAKPPPEPLPAPRQTGLVPSLVGPGGLVPELSTLALIVLGIMLVSSLGRRA